ncbi:MAG: SpoIID/LytB domain-containing protein [Clostridia bacterium]
MTCSKRRSGTKIMAMMMVLALLALTPTALGEQSVPIKQADMRSQVVRVLLSRLGISDRIDLTLASPYGLQMNGMELMRFAAGSELSILLKNGSLYLYYAGMSLNANQSLHLTRYAQEAQGGLRITNYPALYQGDLSLDVLEGAIRPVLTIDVEDYLLGVVPYEMNNAFPLEALKAQAITARTYALRKQNSARAYDVLDTTNDQVFRGYVDGYNQAEQAVHETRGICGFYQDKLAQCFYAASNGGQTELVSTVWPTNDDMRYYAFGADEYDVENPSSTVKRIVISKKAKDGDLGAYGLRKLLSAELAPELAKRGFDAAPESVRVDEVSALKLDTPKGEKGSKLLTQLHLTVRVSGRTRTDVVPAIADLDTEEVSLFAMPEETAVPTSTPSPAPTAADAEPTPAPTPVPTPAPAYGAFTPIEESFTLNLPIFPTAEKAFGMDISSNYDNELWVVAESDDAYTVQARRFGHGVGMSQRGAEWMAARYEKTYQEILSFYYPGMELRQFPEMATEPSHADAELSATAGPAPTLIPRPTLMPTTLQAAEGQWFALITGIEEDSSLNLRAEPDLSGEVVRRLYKNQRLLVVERCAEEGWVKVKTDVTQGYVVEKYLTAE